MKHNPKWMCGLAYETKSAQEEAQEWKHKFNIAVNDAKSALEKAVVVQDRSNKQTQQREDVLGAEFAGTLADKEAELRDRASKLEHAEQCVTTLSLQLKTAESKIENYDSDISLLRSQIKELGERIESEMLKLDLMKETEGGSPFGEHSVCKSKGLSYSPFSMALLHLDIQYFTLLYRDGTIPYITLILGGNLIQGLRRASIKPVIIITIICVRYVILPMIRILVIKTTTSLGLLPSDPLFSFVLLIQYTVPPAMNISTMTQLFSVGQGECSVLTMWCYLVAAIALTGWSTVFMWILT